MWVQAKSITGLSDLASHVDSASGPLREAVVRLREAARAELEQREDAWRPVSAEGAAWLASAREAVPGASITIDVRGRPRAADVVRKPIYRRKER